jgi:hypothetical protein
VDVCHHPPTSVSSSVIWGEYCGTVPQTRIMEYLNTKCHRNYILVKTNFAILLREAQNNRNVWGARVIVVPFILYYNQIPTFLMISLLWVFTVKTATLYLSSLWNTCIV